MSSDLAYLTEAGFGFTMKPPQASLAYTELDEPGGGNPQIHLVHSTRGHILRLLIHEALHIAVARVVEVAVSELLDEPWVLSRIRWGGA